MARRSGGRLLILAAAAVACYYWMTPAPTPAPPTTAKVFRESEVLQLNNGLKMPRIGFGTWRAEKGKAGEAVKHAMKIGYRHIDLSPRYLNEPEIGAGAFGPAFSGSPSARSEYFLASKLWNTDHLTSRVRPALDKTLSDLQLTYLDLWYMHWPVSLKVGHDTYTDSQFEDGVTIAETWAEMEKEYETGRVRSLGVSNFNVEQLQELFKTAKIKPAVNQIEMHPYLPQGRLVRFCREHGIQVVAYCPIGSPGNAAHNREDVKPLIKHESVVNVATEASLTPAQVLLKWLLSHGIVPIPKSVTPSRIEENYAAHVDGKVLSDEQINAVASVRNTVDSPVRYCPFKHLMKPGVTPIQFWGDDGGEML